MKTLTLPILRSLRPAMPWYKGRCLVGVSLGFLAFLFIGLLPSVLVGGSVGVQLANLLLGAQDAPAFGFRAFTILGVLSATTLGAAVFLALGAAAGAAVGELGSDRVNP